MTVSMALNDCRANEKQRAAIARQVAEYERRHGPVKTIPPQRRSPDTRVDLVINAKSIDGARSADGKHNERNKARRSIPVVRPDHPHPITSVMLGHAFRKLNAHKKDAAAYLGLSPSRISNICNQARPCSDKEARELLTAIWKLHEAKNGN